MPFIMQAGVAGSYSPTDEEWDAFEEFALGLFGDRLVTVGSRPILSPAPHTREARA